MSHINRQAGCGRKRGPWKRSSAAARALLASGVTPTVAEAAETALVSRTTAYRYFPTQQALLLAAYPEIGKDSVLGDDPPDDVETRFEIVFAEMARQVTENEMPLRAMLKLSSTDLPDETSRF